MKLKRGRGDTEKIVDGKEK